jgi:flagellar protein FliS
MNYMNHRSALQKYNQVRAHVQTEGASPHRLIQILMEGALEKIHIAKGLMERHDIPEKVSHIDWALSIIDGLRQSLDLEKGGEIAKNLESLYDYIQRRIIIANMENNPQILDEVASLLVEIKSAWDAVPEIIKKEAQQHASGQASSTATSSV